MQIRNVRHIYSQALDIRVGPLRVRRFNLNRHLPEKDWVAAHKHRHSQFLLYLTGNGSQRIGATTYEVRPGKFFFLPPRCEHSFVEGDGRRPLCLTLDLELPGASQAIRANLTQADLQIIRQALSVLHDWQPGNENVRPREAAAVLQILDVLMRTSGLQQNAVAHATLPVVRRVREVFRENQPSSNAVSQVAEIVGYHPDHLTRILRRETGMSTGQLRAAETLKRAHGLLAGTDPIATVAEKSGFTDPNYFTRWFRRQTGVTPTQWRAGAR
ncbi:MAG: AraC family transcriptional regulator [Chthoniobacterales bacterium]